MKHSNISIFIPHIGCPHRCSFCDQRTISGSEKPPRGDDVRGICSEALEGMGRERSSNTQIAFFGGSFTAIDRRYMIELLEAACEFTGENAFSGIRISTRPDFIDREVLSLLKKYNVTAIELGAQSLDDGVLEANERGHTAKQVADAARLIRETGFELGLQIIPGLYKSNVQKELATMQGVIEMAPDTVRIYPIVVIEGTKLADYYRSGVYELMPFDSMVELCSEMMMKFESSGIRVIKCGLHASDGVSGEQIAGYYHPAFRELCQGSIYRKKTQELISRHSEKKSFEILVGRGYLSQAIGQKKANVKYFKQKGIDVRFKAGENMAEYEVEIVG